MSHRRATTVAILFCVLGWPALVSAAGPQELRPITVRVTDAASGKPLPGIVVHYLVLRRTDRTSTLWILPPIEPLVERTIEVKKSALTDGEGQARFEGAKIELRKYVFSSRIERIDSEMVFVNLRPLDRARSRFGSEGERLDDYDLLHKNLPELPHAINVNPKYKGHVLVTADISEPHGREQELASFSFRPDNSRGESEAFFTLPLREAPRTAASAMRLMAANSASVRDAKLPPI
jgi:hypothetical protein